MSKQVGVDFVICPICGHEGQRIYKHIKSKHGLSVEDFNRMFPDKDTTCSKLRDRIKSNTKLSLNTDDVVSKRKAFRNSDEGKRVASENARKAWDKEGFRDMMSKQKADVNRRCWGDSEFKRKTSESIRKSLNTERVGKLHHDRLVKQWEDPEYRKRMTDKAVDQLKDKKFGAIKAYECEDGTIVKLRSSYELRVYEYLKGMRLNFSYEKGRFWYKDDDGNKHCYIPDFYLEDMDLFLEVKPSFLKDDDVVLRKIKSVLDKGKKIIQVNEDCVFDKDNFIKLLENNGLVQSSTTIPNS